MPEALLPIVFFVALLIFKIKRKELQYAYSARIAMAVMLIITGIGHFSFTKGMEMIIPDFIPHKTALVYITGVLEIFAAVSILISKYQKVVGWLLILYFIFILPINICEAIKHIDIEKATRDGNSIHYLWYRIPLQILFIAWVYLCAVKNWRIKKDESVLDFNMDFIMDK